MLEDSIPMRDDLNSSSTKMLNTLGTLLLVLVSLVTSLIILGALVRANEAGLACPDWPLCFGQILPELDLKIGFELTHRFVAGVVSLLFLLIFYRCRHDRVAWDKAGAWLSLAACLLVTQIILGALTVWHLLAAWSDTGNLRTGSGFNMSIWFAGWRLRKPRDLPAPKQWQTWRAVVAAIMLVAQLWLGGLVSSTFSGLACPTWPTCNGSDFFPTFAGSVGLQIIHRWTAFLLLIFSVIAAVALHKKAGGTWQLVTAVLVCFQIVVGILNVLWGLPVEITGLHSGLAAAIVLTQSRATHDAWCASQKVTSEGA